MSTSYAYENLDVWQKAIEFADYSISLIEDLDSTANHYRLIDQFESAAASIPMNIAEGKGRYSEKEFVRFLYISRASLYEMITLAEIFLKRGWITEEQMDKVKSDGYKIVSMTMGVIRKLSE